MKTKQKVLCKLTGKTHDDIIKTTVGYLIESDCVNNRYECITGLNWIMDYYKECELEKKEEYKKYGFNDMEEFRESFKNDSSPYFEVIE